VKINYESVSGSLEERRNSDTIKYKTRIAPKLEAVWKIKNPEIMIVFNPETILGYINLFQTSLESD